MMFMHYPTLVHKALHPRFCCRACLTYSLSAICATMEKFLADHQLQVRPSPPTLIHLHPPLGSVPVLQSVMLLVASADGRDRTSSTTTGGSLIRVMTMIIFCMGLTGAELYESANFLRRPLMTLIRHSDATLSRNCMALS